jgi:hypothetical protein
MSLKLPIPAPRKKTPPKRPAPSGRRKHKPAPPGSGCK